MKKAPVITCLFLDIGGVLLTDGWDHHARKRAAKNFKLEWAEMEARHHLTFDTYEEGKLTLEEYLGRVVFYRKRPFTQAQFRRFMFAQSKPHPNMIDLVGQLKVRHKLEIVVVSNEGRDLNVHRIRKFKLDRLVDSFISSSLRPHPQARPRHVPAGAGYLPGASPSSRLYRKHTHVRPGRRRFGDSKHFAH